MEGFGKGIFPEREPCLDSASPCSDNLSVFLRRHGQLNYCWICPMDSRVNGLWPTEGAGIMKLTLQVAILLIFSPRPSVGQDDVSAPLRALEHIRSAEADRAADPGS